MQVFMVQGSLIGIFGTLAGLIGGITLTLNLERILGAIESVFNVKLLPEDVLHHRPADRHADGRRGGDHRGRAADELPGHPVSRLAGSTHPAGGGPAL